MYRHRWILPVVCLGMIGCSQAPDQVIVDPPMAQPAAVDVSKITLSDAEISEIKKLPDPADQKAALEQKICAVNEDEGKPVHLGAMDTPIKKVVNGKTVFLCCNGCTKDLEKDPQKYLARIGK